jgi:hypothetical protein
MKTGYLLIADILGFSNIIKNISDDELNNRLKDCTNLIKDLGNEYGFTEYQLLSDTLFLSVNGNEDATFEKLIQYCQELLSRALEKFIPIKGAVTFGTYEWSDFIFGKAVIEGHTIESNQNWIGISMQSTIPNIKQNWGTDKIVCYPTPMKSGKIQLSPVIAWAVPNSEKLIKQTVGKGLTKEGELLNWSWAEKIKNTIEFKIYLDTLKKDKLTGETFNQLLPIQTIERNLKSKCE